MKVYIAGPMTNMPQFNVPLFDRVAAELRQKGYEVVSPAELDSSTMRQAALESHDGNLAELEKTTKETWGHVLARDVLVLSDHGIEGIVLLPDWYKSRGVTLEANVGLLNDLQFFAYSPDNGSISAVPKEFVLMYLNRGYKLRWGQTV